VEALSKKKMNCEKSLKNELFFHIKRYETILNIITKLSQETNVESGSFLRSNV